MANEFWKVEWDSATRSLFARLKAEASSIGDDYLGTEHLLLVDVNELPVDQRQMTGLKPDAVRSAILAVTGPRGNDIVTITPFAQTPRLKLVIERAMQRAFAGGRSVSCRDVWYGLLADPNSECVRVLTYMGIQIDRIQEALAQ